MRYNVEYLLSGMRKIRKRLPKLTKRRVIALFLIVGLIGGIFWWRGRQKKNGYEESQVSRGEVVETLVLSGEIKAVEHAKLSYETSGKVVYVGVSEGDVVKKGMLLGKLETTNLNAAYQQALSALRKYEATVANIHDQVKDHSGDETYAQKDLRTTAEATKDSAYEAVVIAERNLKGASLYAPFAGVVVDVMTPFSGVYALATQTQFELLNPETIYLGVSADQTEVVRMKVGQEVGIVLDSFPDEEITGIISEISYAPDPMEVGVVYELKVKLNESGVEYRLGMTGDAAFVMQRVDGVLRVPTGFVKSNKDGKYLLLDHGKREVPVEVGVEGEEYVEVRGSVGEGDLIYD